MVNVNGDIIGLTRSPRRFVTSFRKLRRAGRINEFVSVYINQHHKVVYVACDAGRICRPMIVVEQMRPRATDEHIKVLANSFVDTAEAKQLHF
jgi:DNA-directed RNA polymerase III subunit RPC2